MVMVGPNPTVGQNATITVDTIDIVCTKYQVSEADRFGNKISEGDLRYQDFNPFESAESISNGLQGAGIQRMSDVEHTVNLAQPYKGASGVNASGIPIILAPQQILETLPGALSTPVWIGEFIPAAGALAGTRQLVAIAGARLYTRDASGSGAWTFRVTLAANALKSAVIPFKGKLVIGYGTAALAQAWDGNVLTNVTTAGPTNLYVFATTSDQAAIYIAGGTTNTSFSQVMSSTLPDTAYATPVQCGTTDWPINSLAPGGGVALLFVGKENELGQIDTSGVYHTLIPFDSHFPTNCSFLRWWLGSGGDAQRGPVTLVFPRERSMMQYAPSSVSAGDAQNIAPWANPVVRPTDARGLITAVQGTARWLYFTVTTGTGHSWVWRRDSWVGPTGINASHIYLDLGAGASETLAVSSLTSATGNPMLYAGLDTGIVSIILPLDGEFEADDPNCRFASTGYLDLSDIDLGFPDEDKVTYTARIIAENLTPGAVEIYLAFAIDGGVRQEVGTMPASGVSIQFPSHTVGKRLSIRLTFNTNDPGVTPRLWAFVVRESLNPILYRVLDVTGTISSGGSFFTGADDLSNPKASIQHLWDVRGSAQPVPLTDRWGDFYQTRIVRMGEVQKNVVPDESPSTEVTMTLLLTSGPQAAQGGLFYDTPFAIYDLPTSLYG